MMSPTILWLFYCFAVPNVRSDVELAGANLNSDTSLENNANSEVADNNRNDLDLTRLTSDSNLAVSDANLNHDSGNRLSRQNDQDSSVPSGHSQDNLRNLRSNLNGVGVYDFTNHANLQHPSLSDVNGVLSGLDALHHANAVKNGRLNVVTRSGLNDQNQVSVLDGSQLSALIALNRHGAVGNGVSGLSGSNIIERNGLTNSRGLNALENVIVQRSAALHEVNSENVNALNNVNGLNGENENLLSTVNQLAVVSKNHLGNLLNNNQEQNLNSHLANEVNGQSDSNGVSRSGVSGVYYRSGNVHGLDGVSHGNLGLNHRLVNSNDDNLVKLRLSGANNNRVNGVNSLGLLNNLHPNNLESSNLDHQNNLLNRVHHTNDLSNVLGNSNSNNANLLNELSRSGLLGAGNLNNQKVSLNALKEATKLGLQQPVLLDRSILMGRSDSGLNEEDLLNAADHHNEGKLNALSALVSISDVNNNNNMRNALHNLANQNGLSRSHESNLNGLGLVEGSNRHHNSHSLTSSTGLHVNNVNSLKSSHPALLVNSVSLNSLSNTNVDGESGLNSLNTPEPLNREHENLSSEDNSLYSEAKLETRLPAAEIESDNENRRYLGGMINLGLGHGKGWGPNKVIYSPYDLPNPVPYRPYNRPVVLSRPYRPQGWYQPYQPTTYIPYLRGFRGRSGLNEDVSANNDAVDLSTLLPNVNNLNNLDSLNNKLVDLTDYDIDNLLSLFEKTELNGISTGKNELRSGVEVNSDYLASELDALNLSELNNKNLNNRRILNNILRRLHSNSGKNAKVANNDLLNFNNNAQNELNKLVGIDSLAVKSNNNDLVEAVNEALKSINANGLNLEDVENVVANARRDLMRRG